MIDALGEIGVDVSGETATAVVLSSSDACVCGLVCMLMLCCSTNASMIACRDRSQAFFLTGGRRRSFSNFGWNKWW